MSDYFDTNDKCAFNLNDDNSFCIVYQEKTHTGTYFLKEVDNETGFKGRQSIYIGKQDYPSKKMVSSFYLHLETIDEYDSLPDVLNKFFNKYINSQSISQFLYIHTFANTDSFNKYGRSKKRFNETDDNHFYKEICYYAMYTSARDEEGNDVPLEELRRRDPEFDLCQITDK